MPDIEYFYSAHSAYAYIGSALLMQVSQAAGARIIHRPVDLRRVIHTTGPQPTNSLTPERKAYFSGREIQRWSEYRDVEIMAGRPTHHDNSLDLSNGMLIAGLQQGLDMDELAHAVLEAHWRDDADLDDADSLTGIATRAGYDPMPLLDMALSDDIQAVHQANTDEAIERSVFGSPTYFVGGDMFYGQDHLELVARALEKPFKGVWPPA